MTIIRTGLSEALQGLERAVETGRADGVAGGNWRWTVRQRMAELRDALAGERGTPDDGWLAARGGNAFRERNALLMRMSTLGPRVLESPDVEGVRDDLRRLVRDIGRHLQRLNDLVYDDVELELGGSE